LLPFAALVAGVPALAEDFGWTGRYRYVESAGRTAGGSAVVIEHTLDLAPATGVCRLRRHGFQTDETIVCGATLTPGRAAVRFQGYGDGSFRNRFGVERYRRNELLFELERPGRGAERGPVTRFSANFKPDGAPGLSGIYFRPLSGYAPPAGWKLVGQFGDSRQVRGTGGWTGHEVRLWRSGTRLAGDFTACEGECRALALAAGRHDARTGDIEFASEPDPRFEAGWRFRGRLAQGVLGGTLEREGARGGEKPRKVRWRRLSR
jgi:hypothetical protein